MSGRRLYKQLYKELRFQHSEARSIQEAVDKQKRDALEAYRKLEGRNASSNSSAQPIGRFDSKELRQAFIDNSTKDLSYGKEVLAFLRSQRTYKALLARYNPGATIDDQERIRLSAQRVGLQLPKSMSERIQ
jgi:ATP synthase assembly factor FMC1